MNTPSERRAVLFEILTALKRLRGHVSMPMVEKTLELDKPIKHERTCPQTGVTITATIVLTKEAKHGQS